MTTLVYLVLWFLVTMLSASETVAAVLTASWVDNSSGDAAFELERRSADESMFSTLAHLPPLSVSYVDATVVPGLTYCYRVKAVNSLGESPYSNEACGIPASDAETAPTDSVAAADTSTKSTSLTADVSQESQQPTTQQLDPQNFTISITKAGTGDGIVAASAGGIICGGVCSAAFAPGTIVTLKASASLGSTFVGWSGGCSGSGPCTLSGNTSVAVTATFMRGS